MSKADIGSYGSYIAQIADSVKGAVGFFCSTVEEEIVRYLKEVGYGA